MKGFELLKEINDATREKDPVESAYEEMEIEFGGDANGEPPQDNGFQMGDENELEKLAHQLKDEVANMDEMEARERIASELEMLEYSPEEVEQFLPTIMDKINILLSSIET